MRNTKRFAVPVLVTLGLSLAALLGYHRSQKSPKLATNIKIDPKLLKEVSKYRYVPHMFNPSLSNFWSFQVVMDEDARHMFCVPRVSMPRSMVHLLPRTVGKMEQPVMQNHEALTSWINAFYKSVMTSYDETKRFIWRDYNWKRTAFAREPLDRFILSYTRECVWFRNPDDKIIKAMSENWCYGCGDDLPCFVDKFIDVTLTYLADNDFKTFWMSGYEFYPQFWACGYVKYYHTYEIVKVMQRDFSSYYDNFLDPYLIKKFPSNHTEVAASGWGPNKRLALKELDTYMNKDLQKEIEKTEDRLKSSPEIVKKLVSLYAIDYLAFDFDLPEWVQTTCPDCRAELAEGLRIYQQIATAHKEL